MSKLSDGFKMHSARTENGAVAHSSTLSDVVDYFVAAGASRNRVQMATEAFFRAAHTDKDLAVRILLHSRDIRQGMGERAAARATLARLPGMNIFSDEEIQRIMLKLPELGRWDDLLVFFGTRFEDTMFKMFEHALAEGNALAAKWLPRRKGGAAGKNKLFVHKFCKYTGLTRQEYQKVVADLSKTVEQKICAKEFSAIDYNHVPSVAASRYQKLFKKHDEVRYGMWVEALAKPVAERDPKVKVNAGAVYPYDIVRSLRNVRDDRVAQAQWEALPDFMNGSTENILWMTDVSGSMTGEVFGTVDALDIGVSLAMYSAERNHGIFKDTIMVYSNRPFMIELKGSVRERFNQVMDHVEYGSTNLQGAFDRILEVAQRNNLAPEDMPTKIVITSDMQFNAACGSQTNFEAIRAKFARAGYAMPSIVFWYLSARGKTFEATIHDTNVAMVSGFSPATLKAVLGGDDLTPMGVVRNAVCIERYDW